MQRWVVATAFGLAIAGCGDDVQPGDGGTTQGTMSGAASTGVADDSASAGGDTDGPGADATDGGDASTDSASDASTTGATDTGAGSSTGAADSSSSESESGTGAQGNVVYTAHALIGALDRIRVFKEDLDADRCTWIVLVSPAIGGTLDVTTPEGWSVESIQASDVGAACGSRSPAMFGAESATSAEGSIELGAVGPSGVYPCEVTVDVTASFAGILPGVPPIDVLAAAGIPVDGC